jgi:hypothetical protein
MPLMTERKKPSKTKPAGKKRKPPNRSGEPINVWVDPELRAALNAYVEEIEPRTTLTGAVELALKRMLTQAGYWPRPTAVEKTE